MKNYGHVTHSTASCSIRLAEALVCPIPAIFLSLSVMFEDLFELYQSLCYLLCPVFYVNNAPYYAF